MPTRGVPGLDTSQFITAQKTVATGQVTLQLTTTASAITFAPAMPNASAYTVHFEPNTGVAASMGVTNKTVTSFTMWSVGVAVTVKFTVTQD